jgi:hypothetical protein
MNKRKTPTAEQARFKYVVHLLAGRARRRKISAAPAEVLESDFKNGTIAYVCVCKYVDPVGPARPPARRPAIYTYLDYFTLSFALILFGARDAGGNVQQRHVAQQQWTAATRASEKE